MKDKSYRSSDVGGLVGRYIRWARNEAGFTPSSIRDYEAILARMSTLLADKQAVQVDIEDLRDIIDHFWGQAAPRTRGKVTSVIRAFWEWCEEEGHVPSSPASRLRRPKPSHKVTPLLPAGVDDRVIAVVKRPRDRLGMLLLLDTGIRRNELRLLQVRDFDLQRRTVTVKGKGQKERSLPIRGRVLEALLSFLETDLDLVGRRPQPSDYVLYPEKRAGDKSNLVIYWADPTKAMSPNGVHRWWYRQLEALGYVSHGVTAGMNMHRARHTFATEVRKVTKDSGTLQHLLGHSDVSTTIGTYGHVDFADLEGAMEALDSVRNTSTAPTGENGLK